MSQTRQLSRDEIKTLPLFPAASQVAIKQLGIQSRKRIEQFVGKHIFLELTVKVRTDWRNDPKSLDRFGYN